MPESWSGILNEKLCFCNADDFFGSDSFCTGTGAESRFIVITGGFKFNPRSGGRCRSAAPASTIAHRNGENFAATGERSAGGNRKSERERGFTAAKPGTFADCCR